MRVILTGVLAAVGNGRTALSHASERGQHGAMYTDSGQMRSDWAQRESMRCIFCNGKSGMLVVRKWGAKTGRRLFEKSAAVARTVNGAGVV